MLFRSVEPRGWHRATASPCSRRARRSARRPRSRGDRRLRGGHFSGDQVRLDGVCMEAVIELGQGAVEVPCQGEPPALVVLETTEFLDKIDFELGADPHAELEGDIGMRIGAAITSRRGLEADGVGFVNPFLDADFVASVCQKTTVLEAPAFGFSVRNPDFALPKFVQVHDFAIAGRFL